MIHENELSYEFGGYMIKFSFDLKNNISDDEGYEHDFFSFNTITNFETIKKLFSKGIELSGQAIIGTEYLGDRDGFGEGRSITNEMYYFLEQLNNYQKGSVFKNDVYIDYGDSMCNSSGIYIFNIGVTQNLWKDLEFAKYVCYLFKMDVPSIPSFYNKFFQRNIPIIDTGDILILSTNTKVRRLGYFKILSLFLSENKQVPVIAINKKFEKYCSKYTELLEQTLFKKGLIKETKTGISAKPYIDTAIDLGFLNKINSMYHTGKSFKVYQVIQHQSTDSTNIFELTTFDKIYFLECILRNDFFYFNNLLELIFVKGLITYSDIISLFQNKLLDCLHDYRRQELIIERKIMRDIDKIIHRIKSWLKPEVYLEHIIMPRLNWMLDLGIITGANNEFQITEIGKKLFKHLCIWNDINTKKIISPDAFINRFIIHVYDDCYNISPSRNPEYLNVVTQKMYEYVSDSFKFFRTLAPNRVTSSQAINYTKYKLYLKDLIRTEYQFIFRKLSEKEQDQFIFKYQEQYQDGYIQKRN
jgi:hypothetical protein